MSNPKTALKAAKAAIDAGQFGEAVTQAGHVLAGDPVNYHANVFLGLALDKQSKYDEAVKAYSTATNVKGNDALAWQGLISLYEKLGSQKLEQYREAAVRLAEIYRDLDDKTRCQTVIDRFVLYARDHGTRSQYKDALWTLLPSSPLYDYLEGRIPHCSYTYRKVAEIIESEEKERINKEIGERRTRLGARIEQVTIDVKREVFGNSLLESIYHNIVSTSHEDEIRREYEEKLLRHAYDTLTILPLDSKSDKLREVQELTRGMVILKHPFKLAWDLELEWKDGETLETWDIGVLLEYVHFFPEDGLSKVLKGYLAGEPSPFPTIPDQRDIQDGVENEKEGALKGGVEITSAEDRLLLLADGIDERPTSIMAHRLMSEYFLFLEEHESAVEICRKAKHLITKETQKTGLSFQSNLDAIEITLATCLIYYQTPKNHPEATTIFRSILKRKQDSTAALIGIGLISEDQEDYTEAIDFFSRAVARNSGDVRIRAELAWCRALKGDLILGLEELESCLTNIDGSSPRSRDLKAQTQYRIGTCLWNLNPSSTSRKDRKGAYSRFLSSLQANINFAPAYTSLGVYYADYAKDKKRARKCFQKAFELSASEIEAAERLARAFADEREWDLVEIIAARVIETGKLRPTPGSKKKGISWPFAAHGVVQLNKQDYVKSVISFQSALRISPDDYHCWVGLGESYHNSGRYIAATRAFQQAEILESQLGEGDRKDSWFAKYMLANVNRELGDYDEAIGRYKEVLGLRDWEFGVLIALMQTLVDGAWRSLETGFYGKAAARATEALELAPSISERNPDAFNLWKAIGDACIVFSFTQDRLRELPASALKELFTKEADSSASDLIANMDGINQDTLSSWDEGRDGGSSPKLTFCLVASILAHKRALDVASNDVHAQAVACYNLGWTEYRAHGCNAMEAPSSSPARSSKFLKAAITCFKRAIELEAGNNEFWNALGVVTTQLSPKISQHSFIRSLHLNDKNARVWTNIGTLFLLQNDYQLANDAFARAQSTDPDYAQAWLGQGLLAVMLGDSKEAQSLFTHAFEIADSLSPLTKRQYATSTFDHVLTSQSTSNITNLIQPLFALHQLRSEAPHDLSYHHLFALYLERIGDYTLATDNLASVCETVEQEYEESESMASLAHFAMAKADSARFLLAAKDYDAAAESAETALQLSSEAADDEAGAFDLEARRKCRLSAHLTAGLAFYFTGAMDRSIDMFRAALEESDGAVDVVCLLAQVLWAKGGEKERGVAKEQLLDCMERNSSHLPSIILLGIIAAYDEDQEVLEGVKSDLQAFRTNEKLDEQEQRKLGRLLTGIAALSSSGDNGHLEEISEAKTSIMISPSQPHGWSQLADLTNEAYPADMAVKTAQRAVPPTGTLQPTDLAKALSGTGKVADMQRAILLAPSMQDGWRALACTVPS
ncbi:MAG: Superkiller protein 3 [Sclerophora amabilis]|nr:MAG: Superkiller protein 3 [Sclerophora amabilis]